MEQKLDFVIDGNEPLLESMAGLMVDNIFGTKVDINGKIIVLFIYPNKYK